MSNLREIKKRIKSVKNTVKVTKAMQMISATKSKKSEIAVKQSRDFTKEISKLISSLYFPFDNQSLFLRSSTSFKNVAIVVVGPGRGFAGSLIANLSAQVLKFINSIKADNPDVNFTGISVHKLGFKILNNLGIQPKYHFADFLQKPNATNLSPIFRLVLDNFQQGNFDQVFLVFPEFVSLLNFKVAVKKLLPLDLSQLPQADTQTKETIDENYIFEPGKQDILDALFQKYFENQLISAVLNSNASEDSVRMMTMKNATDNALNISSELTLEYNKQRQAKITQQIIEVSGGRKL